MLKIGEFSRLSHLTVKTLRFYEKEGLLAPTAIDEWTGYRFYETAQLELASRIKSYRQLGFSIEETKSLLSGADPGPILRAKAEALVEEQKQIEAHLSIIDYILEEHAMKYHVTEKIVPKTIVYYSETVLKNYGEIMQWIPNQGAECLALNPNLKCQDPPYEFCEYLDEEYKETDIRIRHNEAVTAFGKESENIKFREVPETKVLSIFHKGPYDLLPEAYAFIVKYAEENGYACAGPFRECYIDGIWNKEDSAEWLTEVQLPIK